MRHFIIFLVIIINIFAEKDEFLDSVLQKHKKIYILANKIPTISLSLLNFMDMVLLPSNKTLQLFPSQS